MNTGEKLKKIIDNALEKSNINTSYIIEIPNDKKNGDFSTNVALELTRILKKNPRLIAEEIVTNIEENNIIDRIDIAGPGFINFYLKKNYILSGINEIIKENDNYGRSNIGNNKKINIEYVSANPTGILHVGTARGASY